MFGIHWVCSSFFQPYFVFSFYIRNSDFGVATTPLNCCTFLWFQWDLCLSLTVQYWVTVDQDLDAMNCVHGQFTFFNFVLSVQKPNKNQPPEGGLKEVWKSPSTKPNWTPQTTTSRKLIWSFPTFIKLSLEYDLQPNRIPLIYFKFATTCQENGSVPTPEPWFE